MNYNAYLTPKKGTT